MAKKRSKKTESKSNGNNATLGFEEKHWLAADKLRGSIDAAYNIDFVGLSDLGHESIQTTSRYTQRGENQHAAASEHVRF